MSFQDLFAPGRGINHLGRHGLLDLHGWAKIFSFVLESGLLKHIAQKQSHERCAEASFATRQLCRSHRQRLLGSIQPISGLSAFVTTRPSATRLIFGRSADSIKSP